MDRPALLERAQRAALARPRPDGLVTLTGQTGHVARMLLERRPAADLTDALLGCVGHTAIWLAARGVDVADAIDTERARQNAKWQRTYDHWPAPAPVKLAVLLEELGEVADAHAGDDGDHLDDELVQYAAVALAWLEARPSHDHRG
jgi:hypothetical protein